MLHDHLLNEVAHRGKHLCASQGFQMSTSDRTPHEIEDIIVDERMGRERQPRLIVLLKAERYESADDEPETRVRVGHSQAEEPILLLG